MRRDDDIHDRCYHEIQVGRYATGSQLSVPFRHWICPKGYHFAVRISPRFYILLLYGEGSAKNSRKISAVKDSRLHPNIELSEVNMYRISTTLVLCLH